MRRLQAAALALALVGLTACTREEDRKLDTAPIERGIARGIERDRPGTKVVSVVCPKDVQLKKGVVFTCFVTGSKKGQEAKATVTQVDDEWRVRYRVP